MAENTIREMQKVELEMLIEVDRICKKYNIKYFLVAGTLLGAVRHKGFIPWDDDIDIAMPMDEYRRFCKVAKDELSDQYFLQNYRTDVTSWLFTKIRKNNTTAIEENRFGSLFHQGIWIDVFPFIGVKNDDKWLLKFNKNVKFIKKIITKKIGLVNSTEGNFLYAIINKLTPLRLVRFVFGLLYNRVFQDPRKHTHCNYLWSRSKITARFPTELFSETCEVEFEGHMFPAPKDWDKYLTIEYGDYMTPPPPEKRNGGSHNIAIVDVNNDYTKYINR